MRNIQWGLIFAAACAGAVTGLLGTGGGMVLVPLLCLTGYSHQAFGSSVALILPICTVTLLTTFVPAPYILPVMVGGGLGGFLAGTVGQKISPKWLHRIFGALVLAGGVRYLL